MFILSYCKHTFLYSSSVLSLLPKDNPFKNIVEFSTAGDWDYVAAVERLPAHTIV